MDRFTQRLAFQVFHGNVRRAVVSLPRLINRDDIGMMNPACGGGLILEPQQEFRVIEKLAKEDLEGDGAIPRLDLLRQENCPHAACSEFADNAKSP